MWVSKLLTENHKRHRVEAVREFLEANRTNSEFLDSIITGDEPWINYMTPKTKEQLSVETPKVAEVALIETNAVCRQSNGECLLGQKGSYYCANSYLPVQQSMPTAIFRRCEASPAIQSKRRCVLTKRVCLHLKNARPHIVHVTTNLIN